MFDRLFQQSNGYSNPEQDQGLHTHQHDKILWVDWDGSRDPSNPRNFASFKKSTITGLGTIFMILVSLSVSSYAIAQGSIMREFNVGRGTTVWGITIFTIMFGVGSLILAPLSEMYGRRWIYIASIYGFALSFIPLAAAPNIATVLIARFFSGTFATSAISIVGGTISDIYDDSDRGLPMAIFSASAFLGVSIGPVAFGIVEQNHDFRRVFWIQLAISIASAVFIHILLPETRHNVILEQKVSRIKKYLASTDGVLQTKNGPFRPAAVCVRQPCCEAKEQEMMDVKATATDDSDVTEVINSQALSMDNGPANKEETICVPPREVDVETIEEPKFRKAMIAVKRSVKRPLAMLTTEPLVISMTIWISFAWGMIYILMESIAPTFNEVYGFSISQAGYVFSTQTLGGIFGLAIDNYGNKLYLKHKAEKGPEARLYNAFAGGILFPAGCWFYAWTARSSIHWIVPCIAACITYTGTFLIYLTSFSYVADAYTSYASSAISATSFVRNIVSAVCPLFTRQLYASLTLAGGGSLVAAGATILALVPFLCYKYGERLRKRSKYYVEPKQAKSPNLGP